MIYRIEVSSGAGVHDARGESIRHDALALGIKGIQRASVADLYFLEGHLTEADVAHLTQTLLCDSVSESVRWQLLDSLPAQSVDPRRDTPGDRDWVIEITLRPGVTDSVAESLLAGALIVGQLGLKRAATGLQVTIAGDLSETDVHRLAGGLLANDVVQTYRVNGPATPPLLAEQESDATVDRITLRHATDDELLQISRERRLSLDLAEMQAIQKYFVLERREPTDVELEMLAQTWSEHCVHKTFRALITYQETHSDGTPPEPPEIIDSLLNTYIRAATLQIDKPWVHSAFVDNAGIVAFDDRFDLAFKVETHNHPSALEPFGGANTGVGGVVRDVIGVSARPIANTDVLCFGPPDESFNALPSGVLHPKRIADGVVSGIEDYGNKMGIPTINGAVLYDPGYTANPLVFCGCLGVLPRGSHRAEPRPGDLVVVIGGRTGRDGLRGATFSSMEMTHETGLIAGSAVQIGHPIHEKQALEAVLIARDEGLYTSITDCGAGGLSSAVGEMAAELGAEIYLDRVPLKYSGLRPWEIWLSEAQERMVLSVPADNWPRLLEICDGLDVEATDLGLFTGDGHLRLWFGDTLTGNLDTTFLHKGIPRRELTAVWERPSGDQPGWLPPADLTQDLLKILAMPDTRSKEDIVRRYDHEVQGGTVVKPFVGPMASGPGDAAVIVPLDATLADVQSAAPRPGAAVSAGINPAYSALDPYAMAWAAVDEAMRNCVAVGADPDRVSLLDNFCWGSPTLPDRLGGLVRSAHGCYDAAIAYGAPFISGKDSLNNEYVGLDGAKHAIPGTLLISALGIVPDVSRTATSDLKRAGDLVYIVGSTDVALGGSAYYRQRGTLGSTPPRPVPEAIALYRRIHQAISAGLVQACHDLSEGGLLVAAAEMSIAGGLGMELRLADVPRSPDAEQDDVIAFSESLGRLLVSVRASDRVAFEDCLAGQSFGLIGEVRSDGAFSVSGRNGQPVALAPIDDLVSAWRGHIE